MPVEDKSQKKPLIIVADDHRATRKLISHILASGDYHLLEADNGKTAYDLFIAEKPDLVLMDIIMPEMDGLQACRLIKESAGGKLTPILMFTASTEGQEMEQAYLAGAADFINKPINTEELRHRVNRLLHLRTLEIERVAAEEKLTENYKEIRRLSRKILHAYEEERLRLARELHDELGMSFSTVKLNLQLLKKSLPEKETELQEKFAGLIMLVDDAVAQVRSKAAFMRPPSLHDLGLLAVLDNMVNELSQNTGLAVQVKCSGNFEHLPPEVETSLYRCIQEAFTNIVKHANATTALVELTRGDRQITAVVSDDGAGFAVETERDNRKHLGIQGMQERVALLGGELEITSAPGEGTTISIEIPLNEDQVGSE